MLAESYAKEPRRIPLTDETMGRIQKTFAISCLINLKPHVMHCK